MPLYTNATSTVDIDVLSTKLVQTSVSKNKPKQAIVITKNDADMLTKIP